MNLRKAAVIMFVGAIFGAACAPDAPNAATSPEASTDEVRTKNAAVTCATGGLCKIGDTGPGAGIVFYDAGSDQSWGRYLEVMSKNLADGAAWCDVKVGVFGDGTMASLTETVNIRASKAIGRGFKNTQDIAAKCKKGVVKTAWDLTSGGKDDWFLPSSDEAYEMVKQNAILNLSTKTTFWTSTEHSPTDAKFVMVGPSGGRQAKDWTYQTSSRAIRAFRPTVLPTTTTSTTIAPTTTVKPTTTSTSTTVAPTTTKPSPTTVASTTTVAAKATGVPCTATSCRIGDTGPNGGLVFITPSTPGNASGLFFEAGLGAAGYNQAFGCGDTPMPDTGSAIGDGLKNTAQILHLCGTSSFVGGLSGTALNDPKKARFLPSTGELAELVKYLPMLKGNALASYGEFWSSTASGGAQLVSNRAGTMSPLSRSQLYGYAMVWAFKADLSSAVIIDESRTYKVGDIGPAGGFVAITPSTPGNSTGKYFEVAPSNWSGTELGDQLGTKMVVNNTQVAWSCPDYFAVTLPGTLTAIGTGPANTRLINEKCASYSGSQLFATREAVKYRGGGRDDWFVPSKDELFTILANGNKTTPKMNNNSPTGSYVIRCIWSSSESTENVGWGGNQFLSGGEMLATKKSIGTNCVIPVRMFAPTETRGKKG